MASQTLTQTQIPFYPPSPIEKLEEYSAVLNADLAKFSDKTNFDNLARIKQDAERIVRFALDVQATFQVRVSSCQS